MIGEGMREAGSPSSDSRFGWIAVLCCSAVALALAFMGIAQLDLPIVRYVRSVTIHLPWDQLTIPWMAFTSNAGDWIGRGSHLVAASLLLLAVGWLVSRPILWKAGLESLIAHGITALVVNGLKHLIGRPRPKFMHSGDWQFTPSLTSGLDSFPSGHAAATFAVATVLARRFPAFGPIVLGVALFVALSRVLRGSHFPTDVVGGAILGALSGSLASAPITQWRHSLQRALVETAVGTCSLLALLWTLSYPREEGIAALLLIWLGVTTIVAGLWLRRAAWIGKKEGLRERFAQVAPALVAYGLAAMTTSPLVLASVGFACMGAWFNKPMETPPGGGTYLVVKEAMWLAGLLVALLLLAEGRAVLPFR